MSLKLCPIQSPKSFFWKLGRRARGLPAVFTILECFELGGQTMWEWYVENRLSDNNDLTDAQYKKAYGNDLKAIEESKRSWRKAVVYGLKRDCEYFGKIAGVHFITDWNRIKDWAELNHV